jgi:hypothetical protein
MKRIIISGIVLALTIIIVLTLRAPQMQVRADEPSLETILGSLGFTHILEVTNETFPAGTYKVTLYAEYAGYRDDNTLKWYLSSETEPTLNLIFDGPEGVPPGQPMGMVSPPITKSIAPAGPFGLALVVPPEEITWFTEKSRNDGVQHAKVYQDLNDPTNKTLFIGFENSGGGEPDYNDMVISLSKGAYTPTGPSVTVEPTPDILFTFAQVTQAGFTTATASTPPPPPPCKSLVGSYYEIFITAGTAGTIIVRMTYDPDGMTPEQQSRLRLLRYDALATDVNKDSKVDCRDVCRVLMALGSRPGSPRWDPACDVNHDDVVNCKDLLAVMKDLGKSAWTGITTFVDTANHQIYGETLHFSGIAIHG